MNNFDEEWFVIEDPQEPYIVEDIKEVKELFDKITKDTNKIKNNRLYALSFYALITAYSFC